MNLIVSVQLRHYRCHRLHYYRFSKAHLRPL
jgi:hypothetical protein